MLSAHSSSAIVAVSDLARARQWYGTTLGLQLMDEDEHTLRFRTGDTHLIVYQSAFAGTNQANAVVWGVGGDLRSIVSTLQGRGVRFEHYPDMDRDGDIHRAGDFLMVWFKDPDGNILHLNSM